MMNLFFSFLKDVLSPKKCQCCRQQGAFLCNKCFLQQDNFHGFCYICKKQSKDFKIHQKCIIENKILGGKNFNDMKVFFKRIIVVSHYRNKPIQQLIKKLKYFGKKDVGQELGEKMGELLENNINMNEKEKYIIVPVPMYFFRKLMRGYNQSEILAQSIAKYTSICYNKSVIKRSRHTRQQSKLSQEKRIENLENAFKINAKLVDKIDKRSVILVDDVVSTGTTINEIAKVLKQHGVREVIGLCLASN